MSEGLQIQRHGYKNVGGVAGRVQHDFGKVTGGEFVKFSSAEKFHDKLQEALGKNIKLAVERDGWIKDFDTLAKLKDQLVRPFKVIVRKLQSETEAVTAFDQARAEEALRAAGEEL